MDNVKMFSLVVKMTSALLLFLCVEDEANVDPICFVQGKKEKQ